MGFLRTVLILLLVYYLLKILARVFGPKLFGYAAQKAEQRFKQQYGNTQAPSPEGEVTVEPKSNPGRKQSKKVGEYVDFEEIG